MIRAEKAHRIMQMYESDYDNFLDKLKAKRKAKKETAAKTKQAAVKTKTVANNADKTVTEAEAYKKVYLKDKAKNLLDKVGGIEGASSTIQNVMKYFKTSTPSDYEMNIGGSGDPEPKKEEKKILGLPPIAVYVGGAVIALAGIYALSQFVNKKKSEARAIIREAGNAPINSPAQEILQVA